MGRNLVLNMSNHGFSVAIYYRKLKNLLIDPFFLKVAEENIQSLRRVVSTAVQAGVPIPAFSSALSFFDGYRSAVLPANLTQAQRDYLGSHTYERIDRERGEFSIQI
jgi:6-phosphogluconate dehydrogenase